MNAAQAHAFIHEHGCSLSEVAAFGGFTLSHARLLVQSHNRASRKIAPPHRLIGWESFVAWASGIPVLTWHMVAERFGCSRATAFRMLAAFRSEFRSNSQDNE